MFSHRTSWNQTPNSLTRAIEAHRQSGRDVLDLTASNPTQIGLRYDPEAILGALSHPDGLSYTPEPLGLSVARAAVVHYYAEVGDASGPQPPLSADSILLTVSTSEAYSFLFRLLCNPDDEILVPTPSYPLFEFLAGLQDVRLAPYALLYDHGWHLDFHSLRAALSPRSRAILLVHPNNPTGSYIKCAERDLLNRICREHDLALVVDEVFLDYAVEREGGSHIDSLPPVEAHERPVPSFAFNSGALTFTLSGISKLSGLPQMKLAWIVSSGPEELVRAAQSRLELIADTYLSLNTPVQLAAPTLLSQGAAVREQLGLRIHANLAELDRQLSCQKLCSRLQVEGGWYVILRTPVIRSDEELAIVLLDTTNVLVQPGYFYDFPGDGCLVLSLITPEETFTEGTSRILGFVNREV